MASGMNSGHFNTLSSINYLLEMCWSHFFADFAPGEKLSAHLDII